MLTLILLALVPKKIMLKLEIFQIFHLKVFGNNQPKGRKSLTVINQIFFILMLIYINVEKSIRIIKEYIQCTVAH